MLPRAAPLDNSRHRPGAGPVETAGRRRGPGRRARRPSLVKGEEPGQGDPEPPGQPRDVRDRRAAFPTLKAARAGAV